VQEANVKIDKLAGLVDLTVGRQFYGEPGDLIVYYGPRDNYGFRTDALDTFRADWKGEHLSLTAIAGRTADNVALNSTPAATGAGGTATDLRGLVLSCNAHENVKPSVYLYNLEQHASNGSGAAVPPAPTEGQNSNLYVLGVKAKLAAAGATGSVEFAKNFGTDRITNIGSASNGQTGNYKGWAFQAKAGYKAEVPDVAAVMPWGEFGLGTGDANGAWAGNGTFQSINTDYRPGGIYGRFDQGAGLQLAQNLGGTGVNPASNGLSNRIIWGLGVKATPGAINKLTAGVQYYRYAFHRTDTTTSDANYKPSRNIGSEVDVTADWKHSDNVSLNLTLGQFWAGAYIAQRQTATNPARMAALDVKVKF